MLSTALAFLLTLAVLIAVHEWGHFQTARWCGVKVLRFSIGFGRVLWRRRLSRDGAEFTLSALPLGGYVRMLDSREAPVAPQEMNRAFDRQPLRKRVAIVAAGPLANLLLAAVLFALAHWLGTEQPRAVLASPAAGSLAAQAGLQPGDWVRALEDQGVRRPVRSLTDLRWQVTQAALEHRPVVLEVTDAQGGHRRDLALALDQVQGHDIDAETWRHIGLPGAYSEPVLGEVMIGGAARDAGLQRGDRVLEVDGRPVPDAAALRELIRRGQGAAMLWRVERAGQVLSVSVTPKAVGQGDATQWRIEAYLGAAPVTDLVRLGPLDGALAALRQVGETAGMSLRMLGRMLIGEASVKNLSGPLTIADYAGQSARIGVVEFLVFLANVSVGLGVLNLLPLPILDGGHLMYYLFEGLTGRPVSDVWLRRLQRGGAVVLLLMMSIALSNDVARLLGLH